MQNILANMQTHRNYDKTDCRYNKGGPILLPTTTFATSFRSREESYFLRL